jgi:hypothetical protein
MDHESINRQTKHIKDVLRIESELANMQPEEVTEMLERTKENAAIRWDSCMRSFKGLFMTLNRGNRWPVDSFNVKLRSEQFNDQIVDTYARVWRSKDHITYNIQPYTDSGNNIYDYSFEPERFSNVYMYRYGTYHSHSAKLEINQINNEPAIDLTRMDGYQVNEVTPKSTAIFLGALEGMVMPHIETTEDSLIFIWSAVLDNDLNPEFADKIKLR